MAELKLPHRRLAVRDLRNLHGFTAVAELKQFCRAGATAVIQNLHGFTAVAELKLFVDAHPAAEFAGISTASPPWPN